MRQVRSNLTERVVTGLLACSDVECEQCPFQNRKDTPRGCFTALARATISEIQRLEGLAFRAMEALEAAGASKKPEWPQIPEELWKHLRSGCTVMPVGALQFRPDDRFPRIKLPGSRRTYVIFPASPGEKEKEDDHDET